MAVPVKEQEFLTKFRLRPDRIDIGNTFRT